jgi:hypothetical protein
MIIPKELLERIEWDTLRNKAPITIENGWDYLREYFVDLDGYFAFLKNLSLDKDKYEKFLYTMFFYLAHDLRQKVGEGAHNIDGFMYQITLSIIEYLSVGESSKTKIQDFTGYFSSLARLRLNDSIVSNPIGKGIPPLNLEFWEVLYDMRNRFIHEAGWFNMPDEGSDMFLSLEKHKKNGEEYIANIKIKFRGYLRFFWEAYLNYFGYKRGK